MALKCRILEPANVQIRAPFRFAISPLLVVLFSPSAFCQSTPRDFHFGSSGQTTIALSEQSIIEATINGKGPFKLFFDTGAAVNVLNPEVIAQLGLTPSGDKAEMWGIGGKLEAKPYRADELRIGDLTLTGQTFYSIPMPLPNTGIVGAVGYELMIRLIVKADNEHHQLTFYDPARFVYNGIGEKLELLPDGRGLRFMAASARFRGISSSIPEAPTTLVSASTTGSRSGTIFRSIYFTTTTTGCFPEELAAMLPPPSLTASRPYVSAQRACLRSSANSTIVATKANLPAQSAMQF